MVRSAHGPGAINQGRGAGPGAQWWAVIFNPLAGNSTFQVIKGTRQQAQSIVNLAVNGELLGPFQSQEQANAAGSAQISKENTGKPKGLSPVSWFQQATGGILAGALEQGFVQILKDIWQVIVGPLEVIAGVIIAIVVLAMYFKNDVGAVAAMIPK